MLKLDRKEIELLKKIIGQDGNSRIEDGLGKSDLDALRALQDKLHTDRKSVTIYVDGASDLARKIAGIGGVGYQDDVEVFNFAEFLPDATNNQAEYRSLIHGLSMALDYGYSEINAFMDSELVVKQINGQYKVKNERMIPLHGEARKLLTKFDKWTVRHVPREQNTVADMHSKNGMKNGG